MRDPARIDRIVEKLRTAWKEFPDMRLVQLIINMTSDVDYGIDLFYIEDGPIEKAIDKRLAGRVKE